MCFTDGHESLYNLYPPSVFSRICIALTVFLVKRIRRIQVVRKHSNNNIAKFEWFGVEKIVICIKTQVPSSLWCTKIQNTPKNFISVNSTLLLTYFISFSLFNSHLFLLLSFSIFLMLSLSLLPLFLSHHYFSHPPLSASMSFLYNSLFLDISVALSLLPLFLSSLHCFNLLSP